MAIEHSFDWAVNSSVGCETGCASDYTTMTTGTITTDNTSTILPIQGTTIQMGSYGVGIQQPINIQGTGQTIQWPGSNVMGGVYQPDTEEPKKSALEEYYAAHRELGKAETEIIQILIQEAGMSEEDAEAAAKRFSDIFRGHFSKLFV